MATDFEFEELFSSSPNPSKFQFKKTVIKDGADLLDEEGNSITGDFSNEDEEDNDNEEENNDEQDGEIFLHEKEETTTTTITITTTTATTTIEQNFQEKCEKGLDEFQPHTPSMSLPLSETVGPHSFEMLNVVGKGGYGKVHQVRMKSTSEIFAMKILKKRFLIKANCVENTKAEKDILRRVRHPFIVGLQYAFQTDQRLYLVMDFINGGQLWYHLKRAHTFTEDQTRFYVAQLVLALEHLHSQEIIHRDLKPENVLLDSDGNIVLTDFGFAKDMVSSDDAGADSFCGTFDYMSPEMVSGQGYGKSTDWWSLGVLMYDMLVGHPPFQSASDDALQKKILEAKFPIPSWITGEAKSLIKGFMERNLKKRLGTGPKGILNIKNHSFFRKINWKKMLKKEISPPFKPKVKKGKLDVSYFDQTYLTMPISDSPSSPISPSLQDHFKDFSYTRSPANFPNMSTLKI